jgi:hypothetical protein
MSDRRIEIYNYNVAVSPNIVAAVQNSMDEYFTERALDLLEYVAKNISRIDRNGDFIGYRGDVFTKEQLFENFL